MYRCWRGEKRKERQEKERKVEGMEAFRKSTKMEIADRIGERWKDIVREMRVRFREIMSEMRVEGGRR